MISLTNFAGQLMLKRTVTSASEGVDLARFAQGTYTITVNEAAGAGRAAVFRVVRR